MVRLLQRCIYGGWGIGDGQQVLGRRVRHHGLSIVVKIRRGTIGRHQNTKLVRSLQSDLVFGRIAERSSLTTQVFEQLDRGKAQGVSSRQSVAGGF